MSTLAQRCDELAVLKKTLDAEDVERVRIKYGPEFIALNQHIEELTNQQAALLALVPDSRPAYDSLKQEAIDMMRREDVYAVGSVSAKFKEKKEVNRDRLLRALDGDLDAYIAMSNVTQVALKEHAKGNAKESELLDCVEVVSRDIVDLVVTPV